MEELTTPLPENHEELGDGEVVMSDKIEANPYITQDFSSFRLDSRY